MQKRQGAHIKIFNNRNQTILEARAKNPLRWSTEKTHQFKVSQFEILNAEKKCIIL